MIKKVHNPINTPVKLLAIINSISILFIFLQKYYKKYNTATLESITYLRKNHYL